MARPGALLLFGVALCGFCVSFVNLPSIRRESVVARGDKDIRAKGMKRRRFFQRQNVKMVEIEGKEMPEQFLSFLGSEEADTPFDVRQATGSEKAVTFKKKPYGIVRWQPGKDFKGAMVKQVAKGVYVNDPLQQARELGVKPGMVIKSINGTEVMSEDFDVIMKKLGDEALGFTTKVKVPLDVVFAEMP
ncbi:unnamed protein product [Effrenium voratum]|nr:unnamed protein product [Effrenium voratum]